MLTTIFKGILRLRIPILLLLLVVTAWFGWQAQKVRTAFEVEQFFPRWDDEKRLYDHYKEVFPREDLEALVLVEGDIFTVDGLQRIEQLTAELEALEDDVEEVLSLTNVQDVRGELGTIYPSARLFEGPIAELTREEVAAKRDQTLADPMFVGRLIREDAQLSTLVVTLRSELNDEPGRARFVDAVRGVVKEHREHFDRITVTGLPVVRDDGRRLVEGDQGLFLIAFLIFVVLIYLTFRSLTELGVAVAVVLVSIIWTLGLMGYLDMPFTYLSLITPIIIMIVGIADTIHIITCHRTIVGEGRGGEEAILATFEEMAVSCFLTTFTTSVGFASLLAMNVAIIGDFGWLTAFGVMSSYFVSMLLLPPVFYYFKRGEPEAAAAPSDADPLAANLPGVFHRIIGALERVALDRPRAVLGGAFVFVALCAFGASQVVSLSYIYDDFDPETDLYQRNQYVDQEFGGGLPFNIFLEATPEAKDGRLFDPEVMHRIDELSRFMEQFPEVGNTISIVDYLKKANQAFQGGDPELHEIPDSQGLIGTEIAFIDREVYEHDLDGLFRAAQIRGRITDCGSVRMAEILGAIRQEIERGPLEHVTMYLTGTCVFVQKVFDFLIESLLRSLGLALGIIFITLLILLRRFRLTAIAMIPNVLPMLFMFAVLGYAGVRLRPSTVLVACIVLGIAVDDTIHFVARLRLEWAKTGNYREAISRTIHTSGLALVATTIILATGFLVLLFSNFEGLYYIGLLVALALGVALLADVLLLPALLILIRPPLGPRLSRMPEETT